MVRALVLLITVGLCGCDSLGQTAVVGGPAPAQCDEADGECGDANGDDVDDTPDPTPDPSGPTCQRYVDAEVAQAGDGTTWSTAFAGLHDALTVAAESLVDGTCGDVEIWVTGGTYTPPAEAGRAGTFELLGRVAIYGGFLGDEEARSERDGQTHTTVLSGDAGVADSITDNLWHVVTADADAESSAVLDGFTIQGGNADGDAPHNRGAGVYVESSGPTLRNLRIVANTAGRHGGGIFCKSCQATVEAVTFISNTAGHDGGGLYAEESTMSLSELEFVSNVAERGAGLCNVRSDGVTLAGAIFIGNSAQLGGSIANIDSEGLTLARVMLSRGSAGQYGGAIYNDGSTALLVVSSACVGNSSAGGGCVANSDSLYTKLINVTATANTASDDGGAILNMGTSSVQVNNSILWGNGSEVVNRDDASATIGHSCVDGGAVGEGNIDADPRFVAAVAGGADGDLHLQSDSPAIDAGDNGMLPDSHGAVDLDGSSRLVDVTTVIDSGPGMAPVVDMGAYERQGE